MADLTSFFLFHFTFELHNIFMVMINIVKIESTNATENCLINISLLEFFLLTELFLIYAILIWSRPRGIDIIWANIFYNILSN